MNTETTSLTYKTLYHEAAVDLQRNPDDKAAAKRMLALQKGNLEPMKEHITLPVKEKK